MNLIKNQINFYSMVSKTSRILLKNNYNTTPMMMITNRSSTVEFQRGLSTTQPKTAVNSTVFTKVITTPINYNFNNIGGGIRWYAKQKDKQKEKAKNKGVKFVRAELSDDQLNAHFNVNALHEQMQKSLEQLKNEFIKNLSLRSTTGSIETLRVQWEGKDHELQEIAQIIRKNPKTIIINMSSFPQMIPIALQCIQRSGMNLNPQQDGTTIFIPIPKITKDHREMLSKNAKALFIKCRDSIKDSQNKILKKIRSQTDIAKDDAFSVQNQIQEITKHYVNEAEKLLDTKQKELIGNDKD